MPQGPAARITDNVVHPLPPVLTPGPGSMNVLIGFLPAWRGIPAAAAAGLQAAKQAADIAVQAAEAATLAAAGTPGAPAAYAAEQTLKASIGASLGGAISAMAGMGADIHMCVTPSPVPPHGPGVVIDGSPTVLINNMQACRMGDTIIEPLGPPNKIAKGEMTVIIGQSGSGGSGGASGGGGGGGGGGTGGDSDSILGLETGPGSTTGLGPLTSSAGGGRRGASVEAPPTSAQSEALKTGARENRPFCEVCEGGNQ